MICSRLILPIVVFVSYLYLQITNAELRLELVQVLFRHGDRTPTDKEIWPSNFHNISTYEPWGLGQLTNRGKIREYRIGKMLRERYNDFLGMIYHPDDVYAISTDFDRTKMSLQLVLAALYQPAPMQSWNEELAWMPIPIHRTIPAKVDNLMRTDLSPVYIEALNKVRNSEEIVNRVSVYKDLFKLLSKETGIHVNTTERVYEIFHSLVAQESMNQTLPKWYTSDISKQIQEGANLEYEIRSYTSQMKRLNGGMLIKKFIDNMRLNSERARPRKIYLYSGHEINIAAFARAHNFTEPDLPSYGSAIIVEKLSDKVGHQFIRMSHWTGITEKLIPYKFSDDSEICSINNYLEMFKKVIPSQEEWNHRWNYVSTEELRKLYDEIE